MWPWGQAVEARDLATIHNGSLPLSDTAREAFVDLLAEKQEALDSRSTGTDSRSRFSFLHCHPPLQLSIHSILNYPLLFFLFCCLPLLLLLPILPLLEVP